MEEADGYLNQPMLSLPAPGDDRHSPSKSSLKNSHNQSQTSFNSNMTSNTSKTNFMALNKDRARSFNPYKKPMICDTLNEQSRSRLDRLTEEIDNDLEGFIKKKEEYYAIELEQSQMGGVTSSDPDNAYHYSQEDVDRIEKINESLRKAAPMLTAQEESEFMPQSAAKSRLGGDNKSSYDHSKFLSSKIDDKQSMQSHTMSTVTRRSNLTMLTH